ncbi:hypothetical protein HS088_TW07G01378 [Tripterygium wilfordii]|uniref:Amino acid transporter transmembrane domain-containing protein n=1 Tax=Tripterygium wilfordii TaxID=458696 RepID=A0A7J7DHS3_TRIWF|nr:hypothetical protein HS088_TW07G01378 [Tripterygium wilfordii]
MFVIIGGERPCTVLPVDVFAWVHLQHKPLAGAESFLVFICMAILLAQGPNLNSIAGFSFVGAITALSIAEGRPSDVSHGPRKKPDSDIEGHSNVLIAIGIIVLAFRGHNLALEIQATLPSSPEKASKKTMCKGVTVSYALSLVPMSLGYSRILGLWKQGTHRLHAKRRAFDSICAVPWPHDFKVCKRTYIHDDHHKQSVFISNLRDAGFRQLGVQVREHQEEVVSMEKNAGEKKGLMEKIKEKLPGRHNKAEDGAAAADVHSSDEEAKDKHGFLEKIKEKLPGSHKNEGEEKKH